MAVRRYKPTSPGRRFMSVSDFSEITKTEPEKTLLAPLPRNAGRNNNGRITTRHQGGGHKRRYRIIDFKRKKDGVPAKVHSIEYDPNRSSRIALLHYADGEKRYILAPTRLSVGQTVESGPGVDIRPGNALPLAGIPTGTTVHNIELRPGQGGKMVRSAGGSAQLVAKEGGMRCCVCRPARCAVWRRPAARPSGSSATRRTRTSPAARPAARAGRASARPCAAPS